jgi:FSR family fosmidomycin resistance protein-like MFS transporter
MTMPITLYLLAKKMKGMEGFAFGLLTFGLFIGFVLTHQKALVLSELGTAGSLLSMVLLAFCLKEEK